MVGAPPSASAVQHRAIGSDLFALEISRIVQALAQVIFPAIGLPQDTVVGLRQNGRIEQRPTGEFGAAAARTALLSSRNGFRDNIDCRNSAGVAHERCRPASIAPGLPLQGRLSLNSWAEANNWTPITPPDRSSEVVEFDQFCERIGLRQLHGHAQRSFGRDRQNSIASLLRPTMPLSSVSRTASMAAGSGRASRGSETCHRPSLTCRNLHLVCPPFLSNADDGKPPSVQSATMSLACEARDLPDCYGRYSHTRPTHEFWLSRCARCRGTERVRLAMGSLPKADTCTPSTTPQLAACWRSDGTFHCRSHFSTLPALWLRGDRSRRTGGSCHGIIGITHAARHRPLFRHCHLYASPRG